MPTFRRAFVEDASYIFTVVTFDRLPVLTTEESRARLHAAWVDVFRRYPLKTVGEVEDLED